MQKTINKFKLGTQYQDILRAITKEDFYQGEIKAYIPGQLNFVKFVPASGAATRMFKDFYLYMESLEDNNSTKYFFENIKSFPFYDELNKEVIKDNEIDKQAVVKYMLDNYATMPKLLLGVHQYGDHLVSIYDEHLYEATKYLEGQNYKLHFTISKEHQKAFTQTAIKDMMNELVEYSFQDPKTNTLAVDMDNNPFLLEDGTVLYRPGGHGSLIYNLNDIDADVIMIKTMDNVCHSNLLIYTEVSKKQLINVGLTVREKVFKYINDLNNDDYNLDEIEQFIKDTFKITYHKDFNKLSALSLLDRPLRVVGLVKNEGEPGGGPFIVKQSEYSSPQIYETKELNPANKETLLADAIYFSPTDLACFVTDYKGDKYNLLDYIDETRYFTTEKTYKGKKLKALEHPGLWNGSMHQWNTVFIEVPLETFNPLKEVKDFLRKGHTGK